MKKALLALILALVFVLSFTLCISAAETNETETTTEGDIILGDVNGDGLITNADVLMIYRYIYNSELYPLPTVCQHEFGNWQMTKQVTCAEDGVIIGTCIYCSKNQEIIIPRTEAHVEVVDEAVAPTCTTNGLTEGKHCSACGGVIVAQTEIDALGHDPSGIIIDTLASCTVDGAYHTKCRRCDEVLSTGIIESQGHTEVNDEAVDPTCTANGLTEGKHCSACGEVIVAQTTVDAYGHTEVIDEAIAPTCTANGLTEGKHCSVCGEILIAQEIVPALGHTEIIDNAVVPDCTNAGLTEGKHCSACGGVIVAQTEIDALGHDPSGIIIDIPASCTDDGVYHTKCHRCEKILNTGSIEKTGVHKYNDTIVSPTSTKQGYTTHTCEKCGDSYNDNFVPALGSSGLQFTSNGDGTCYVSGIGTCTDTDIGIPSISPKGDRVTKIGGGAFYCCASITSVTIPDSVTSIGSEVFYNCTLLTSVTIPSSVTSIGWGAFGYCTSLTSVTIPSSVTSISDNMFYCCSNLASVTIPDSVTKIGNNAFSGIYIPINIYITDLAKWCEMYRYSNYLSHNLYLDGQLVTDLIIPDNITSISSDVFSYCNSITSVTIGDSITTINYHTFSNCNNLSSVTIGNNVELIDFSAFKNCSSLTNITIGDSVTAIGDNAFSGCTNLKDIYYTGTKAQWQQIWISSTGNSDLTSATIHYNYVAS